MRPRFRRAWIVLAAAAALLAIGAGTYWGVTAGGSAAPAPTATPTATATETAAVTTTETATATTATTTATATVTPTATAPPEPTTAPASTATPPVSFGVDCPDRPNNHLNIEKLRAQPGMEATQITEIDDDEVGITIQGVEFTVQGWGQLVVIGGYGSASEELAAQLAAAVDAVRYEC